MPPEDENAGTEEVVDADVDDSLPEGQDTFDRAYVEKLRAEAAQRRTQLREFEQHFEGFSPEERTRFMSMAHKITTDPEAALEDFQGVVTRLAQSLGKEITSVDVEQAPEPEEQEAAAPEPAGALTADDVARLVEERLAAEREQAAKDDEVAQTFAEAEALSDDYKTPAGKAFLLGVAQSLNDGQGGSLAEAHEVITELLQARIDSAVAEYRQGIVSGKAHPPRLPAGDPANSQEDKDWMKGKDALKIAQRRAAERIQSIAP